MVRIMFRCVVGVVVHVPAAAGVVVGRVTQGYWRVFGLQ